MSGILKTSSHFVFTASLEVVILRSVPHRGKSGSERQINDPTSGITKGRTRVCP